MTERVGIVGIPPRSVIGDLHRRRALIFDLDEPQIRASLDKTASYLPRVYCAVLRTVVLNAMHLQLDRIYIDVGPGKCDCALHVSTILKRMLAIPVHCTRNQDMEGAGIPLCRTRMPLLEKMQAITAGVLVPEPEQGIAACRPTAGFWGVPPRDFSLLTLFPDTTHVYGWTRCMENKTPANLELESYVNPDVPTVFFAQSFCAKTALAKFLADQHPQGLYLDCDVTAGSSARAKIEAFFELSHPLFSEK
ncbi:MAG: hypothetical protein DSY57_03020 [Desulfobulbus sp.]|nr:MAG: hypothetical protein DSY57_03020 [Desulfobulbus sp.]